MLFRSRLDDVAYGSVRRNPLTERYSGRRQVLVGVWDRWEYELWLMGSACVLAHLSQLGALMACEPASQRMAESKIFTTRGFETLPLIPCGLAADAGPKKSVFWVELRKSG